MDINISQRSKSQFVLFIEVRDANTTDRSIDQPIRKHNRQPHSVLNVGRTIQHKKKNNVGKTIINHPQFRHFYRWYKLTIPSHGWFMALLFSHYWLLVGFMEIHDE